MKKTIFDQLKAFVDLISRFGIWNTLGISIESKVLRKNTVRVKGYGTIHLRQKTSDFGIFLSVIPTQEYIVRGMDPQVIVDGGANVGMASLLFWKHYPTAKIYAIEPEAENFKILTSNIEGKENIKSFKKALWGKDTYLSIVNNVNQECGFEVFESTESTEISAITLDTLMQQEALAHIDILKLDIEGSEKSLFEQGGKWLDRTDLIIIEMHERFVSGCTESVFRKLLDHNFYLLYSRGENLFFKKSD